MKRPPRKESRLLKTTTKNEDKTMDQNNGLKAMIFKEETRTLLTIDLGEVPLLLTRISLQDQTSQMGITIRTMEDHMINAQVNRSIETIETGLEMDLSTIRVETGETMESFLVLHRPKGETSHKISDIANQEVTSLTILLFADLTINLQLISRLTNKRSRKTIIRFHLLWFALPQPTKPLRKNQASVC